MGKIFYVMGKSASGKDTLYRRLLEALPQLEPLILYTTRPMREGEQEGREYHFVTPEKMRELEARGKLIEKRDYSTVQGVWSYATVDDRAVEVSGEKAYLGIGTLESYERLKHYYGDAAVVPIYITVQPGKRLQRALSRERTQARPDYTELCRRYLADERDFSEERLAAAGVKQRYENDSLERCLAEIIRDVIRYA